MKNICKSTIIILVLLSTGCASTHIEHLDLNEFISRADTIEEPNSVTMMTFIGITNNRAYLEYQNMITSSGKLETVIFWTELEYLQKEILAQFVTAKSPWIPWHQTYEEKIRK